MKETMYLTKELVLARAKELVVENKRKPEGEKITFGKLNDGRYKENDKGFLGKAVEYGWYNYEPNNDDEPDFPEAGVELKVAPYYYTKNGVSAQQRLVCNIINYERDYDKTFEESSFWKKCKCMCLLSYQYQTNKLKSDFYVDHATLINGLPQSDFFIIRRDYYTIMAKIKAGKAHELSEKDTDYLAANTKGEITEHNFRNQPFSDILAKQRSFSFKTGYMSNLLRKYIFGEKEKDYHIVSDPSLLQQYSLKEIIQSKFDYYIGQTVEELSKKLNISLSSKHINARITRSILGLKDGKSNIDNLPIEEIKNANITVKTIELTNQGKTTQAMSFPYFKFKDLAGQTWEDSDAYKQMIDTTFLFVIFKRNEYSEPELASTFFWSISEIDSNEVKKVWLKTQTIITEGVTISPYVQNTGKIIYKNNLPKASENRVSHVRPHKSKIAYKLKDGTVIGDLSNANLLPDGQMMTTQCFWFNKPFIESVLKENLPKEFFKSKKKS